MKKKTLLVGLFLALTLMFAACKKEDPSPTPSPSPSESVEASVDAETSIDPDAETSTEPVADNILAGDNFTLELPEGWTKSESEGVVFAYAPDSMSNVNVVSENVGKKMDAKEYYDLAIESIKSIYTDMEIKSEGEATIGSYDAYTYTFVTPMEDLEIAVSQYIIPVDKDVYIVTYTAAELGKFEQDVTAILASFKIK